MGIFSFYLYSVFLSLFNEHLYRHVPRGPHGPFTSLPKSPMETTSLILRTLSRDWQERVTVGQWPARKLRFCLTHDFLPFPQFRPRPLATNLSCPATRSLLSCLICEDTACPQDATAGSIHLLNPLGSWVTFLEHFSLAEWEKKFFNISYIIRSSLKNLFFYIQLDLGYQVWSSLRYPFQQK